METGFVLPSLIIGVPVGFVNVAQSKEMLKGTKVPYIISQGRKGGSTVSAAIVNALMFIAEQIPSV
jgi:precorrin-8X/cobalt-precorrin-8 methylmutase